MSITKADYDGTYEIVLTVLQGKLVVLSTCSGLRTDQEGLHGSTVELSDAGAAGRAAAGIPQEVYDYFLQSNDNVALIDQHIETVARMAEVLRQSRAYHVDARNNAISEMVDAMRSRAQRRRDESPMVIFKQTIAYHSQIGDKAAQTRKKNAEAAAEAEAAAGAEDTGPPAEPQAA